VQELEGVKDGSNLMELRKIVKLGVSHIKKCERCLSCGFICEVCHSDDVIFPYDVEHTTSVRNYFYYYNNNIIYHECALQHAIPKLLSPYKKAIPAYAPNT